MKQRRGQRGIDEESVTEIENRIEIEIEIEIERERARARKSEKIKGKKGKKRDIEYVRYGSGRGLVEGLTEKMSRPS